MASSSATRHGRLALIGAILVLTGCSHGTPAETVKASRSTLLAFTSLEHSFGVVEYDSRGHRLAEHPVPGMSLAYRVAPDGRSLAWVTPEGPDAVRLGTFDLTTGATTQTDTSASTVDWLPDGRMVGVEFSDGAATIGIVDADGHLTPTGRLRQPAAGIRRFSNTEVLLFESASVTGSSATLSGGVPVIVSLDGTVRRRLTLPHGCMAAGGSTSPDHTKIAVGSVCSHPADNGLYLLSADSGQSARIVAGTAFSPAWSPDGETIAYLGNSKPPTYDSGQADSDYLASATEVWLADAATGDAHQITPDGQIDVAPNWRPLPSR